MVLNSKLNARNKQTIISIEDALERIKNETYGMCKDCEEEIPEKRLLINPYFLTCVGCAESREFNFKSK
jgi:DnaK suppressor protein